MAFSAFSPSRLHRRRRTSAGWPRTVLTRAVLAPGLILLVLLGLAAGPAAAHDELAGSSPADGATVAAVPGAIELTFSSVPSGLGAQVEVLDAEGKSWSDGPVRITDNTAEQSVRAGAPAGEYTVNWRVVSSDSHPIEGVLTFTAESGTSAAPDSAGTAVPIAPAEAEEDSPQAAGTSDFPWSIAVMAVVLLILAAVLATTARKRLGANR
ncbi:copper resistance protein CopC [Arthrobacter sp. MSA 4-2]|uniref:copper resistance CopC family protein n=1 Tax=Arthrobacter sp. MSA 4-2 TaxID=2794349 RepID=UPI0018E703EA|nr:copper resistance CopC family protein [Arthrobacter sp. MSA 4-2]MBJ2120745.1 copper resistance protein CopC [Arthrobacter sp. MSA 4-2]